MKLNSTMFLSRADLAHLGVSDARMYRCLSKGCVKKVRPGLFMRGSASAHIGHVEELDAMTPAPELKFNGQKQLVNIMARVYKHRADLVLSRECAALLHRLPILLSARELPVQTYAKTRAQRGTVRPLRGARLDGKVAQVQGFYTTDIAWTLAELCLKSSMVSATMAMDYALRNQLVTREAVLELIEQWQAEARKKRALFIANFADPKSESPGESYQRVQLLLHGFEPPKLQVTVENSTKSAMRLGGKMANNFYLDAAWKEPKVVLEFDGVVKYRDHGEGLLNEKRREDFLRAQGWTVVRCMWNDLADFSEIAGQLQRANVPLSTLRSPPKQLLKAGDGRRKHVDDAVNLEADEQLADASW